MAQCMTQRNKKWSPASMSMPTSVYDAHHNFEMLLGRNASSMRAINWKQAVVTTGARFAAGW
jgi:hypothetical protein